MKAFTKSTMPKKYFLYFAILLFLSPNLISSEQETMIKGKYGYPYFDKAGTLSLAFSDWESKICINKISPGNAGRISRLDILTRESFSSFRLKKDNLNQLWIIWEKQDFNRNDIYLGQIKEGRIIGVKNLSSELEGINHSPSLDISFNSEIWATWVNYNHDQHTILAKNITTGQKWILPSLNASSAFTPQILVDGSGRVWIFWVGQEQDLDEIFFSSFDGEAWKEPESLNKNPVVPHFHPSAALDHKGNPQLVWAAYDGEDYEIYATSWDGNQWLREEKITDNKGLSDAQPTLSLFLHSIPVVAWTQASREQRNIFLKYKDQRGWSPPFKVSTGKKRAHHPVVISEEDKIALLWQADDYIFLKLLSLSRLREGLKTEEISKKTSRVYIPLLRQKFMAYGDSITYGWMYYKPALDEGYVPRLEALLKETFNEPHILNHGVPGEPTWDAVGRAAAAISTDLALYFLLMEGTNDVMAVEYSMSSSAFNLRQIIKKCLEYGRFPLISTIIPRSGGAWQRWDGFFRKRILGLNEKIKRISQKFDLILVDNFDTFFSYPNGWRKLISDGVHPNEEGYQFMAETWNEKIKTIPFPPEEIKALRNKQEGAIDLTWKENQKITPESEITEYKIYRKKKSAKKFSLLATVDSSVFSYRDESVSLKKDYEYALSSSNAENIEGPFSKPVGVQEDPGASEDDINRKSLKSKN